MKVIENAILFLAIGLASVYMFIEFPQDIYFLLTLGLVNYFFRFYNYRRLKSLIKHSDFYYIPVRNTSTIFKIFLYSSILIFIGLFIIADFYSIIKLRSFKGIDKFVLGFVFPIINLIAYVKFSDLSDKYILTNNWITKGFRWNDFISWDCIEEAIVDDERSIILLKKNDRVLLRLRIEEKFFSENLDRIKKELNMKLNEA